MSQVRALVTGASGFVGGHLVEALRAHGAEVIACAGAGEQKVDYFSLDLGDAANVRDLVASARPTVVFHLAAQTFVPDALADPSNTYRTNVLGTAAVAQAVRDYARGATMPRLLFASSAEVYGARPAAELPLRETLALHPANPYAASKAAAEALLLGEARSFGLDVVVARAFNHIGPGQSDRFVVPALATQLARIAQGAPPLLEVGNLEASRDFLDVRDVVDAYLALAERGEPGEIYNVCSGNAVKIRDVLRELVLIARVPVEIREDPARMRPSDVPVTVGSAEKLRARTGWVPHIALTRSLRDIYEDAVAAVS